jgi:NADH-quinone oxidoreductase subunit G
MCLVEIEGQPKLQPSCVLQAQDGMSILTASETAEKARQAVIEFLLVNHPLDCPICDAAGQCMLQDYAYETRQLHSRVNEAKAVMGRDRVAEDILYFPDRCIICTRCVRFMRDVADDDALIVAHRGHKSYIDTFPGRELDNEFRGNIVDVCPVGALVHEDFVFKARAWDMDSAIGVCPGCSTGCNVTVDTKENQIVRLKPRHNAEVNSYWMCDYGRKHLVMANRGVRAEVPLVRTDERLQPTDWTSALDRVAARIEAVRGSGGVAVVSPDSSNENLFFLGELAAYLGISRIEFRVPTGRTAALPGVPTLQLRADRAANGVGAELLGGTRVDAPPSVSPGEVLIVLDDALEDAPAELGVEAGFFLYIGSRLPLAARGADAVLPIAWFAEMDGTFTNFEGRVQRFHQALQPPGIARPAWMVISRLLQRLGAGGPGVSDIESAFAAAAAGSAALAGLSWESLGHKGRIAPGMESVESAGANAG